MSILSASETKSLLDTLFLFLWSQFGDFDCVNIHSIRVFDSWVRREASESLSGPSTTLGDLIHLIPLDLEMSGLHVPFIDFSRDKVKVIKD